MRPSFHPISRHYGRNSTQYHATAALILPNIKSLRPPFYPVSRHYHRYNMSKQTGTDPRQKVAAVRGEVGRQNGNLHLRVAPQLQAQSKR